MSFEALAASPLFTGLTWLGTYLVHGTLLLAAGLLFAKRIRSIWLRERLLRVALFGGLVTASLQTGMGYEPFFGTISLETGTSSIENTLARYDTAPNGGFPAGPFFTQTELRPTQVDPALQSGEQLAPERLVSSPATDRNSVPTQFPKGGVQLDTLAGSVDALPTGLSANHWLLILAGAWGLWSLFRILRLAFGWLRFRRDLGDREDLTGRIEKDFAALRRRARVYHPVRLTVSDHAPVPVTLGFFRREVCLPRRTLQTFTRLEIRAILAHELAHTKRRDTAWFLAYALVERVFFFQPLNRLVHRELLSTAELSADDLAVQWTGAYLELASSLTEIARWLVGSNLGPTSVPTMARETSRLGTRVLRLLDRQAEGERKRFGLLVCGGLAALASVATLAPSISAFEKIDEQAIEEAPPAPFFEPEEAPLPQPGPTPAPAPLPTPEPAPSASSTPFGLQLDRELFTGEFDQLRDDWRELRSEVEAVEAPALFEAFEAIQHRMEDLSLREDRVNELLDRLFGDEEPDVGGAPRTDVPKESP